jgi:tetratricopeptide (TPR) repeat protein
MADRLDESLAYTREAKAAFANIGLLSGVANAMVNEADVLIDLHRIEEAKAVGMEALEVAREAGHQRWCAGAMAVLAQVALEEGDYATSMEHSTESIRIFELLGDEVHAKSSRERLEAARERAEAAS